MFKLGQTVWVIHDRFEGQAPCETCGQSEIKRTLEVVETEVSDVYTHRSLVAQPENKYRVRIDGEVREQFWFKDLDIYSTEAEAKLALEEKQKELD